MSTWISKAALVLALAVAACVPGEVAGRAPSPRAAVLGGALVAAVPQGYCFDPSASHAGSAEGGAVMVAGRCSAATAQAPAVISISFGGPGSSEVLKSGGRALSDWFTSRAGRAALARDGRAGSVRVQQTLVADGAFLLLVADRQAGTYWRAVLGLSGHLVTVSVLPPQGEALDPKAARVLLDRTVAVLRAAN